MIVELGPVDIFPFPANLILANRRYWKVLARPKKKEGIVLSSGVLELDQINDGARVGMRDGAGTGKFFLPPQQKIS